MNGTRHEISGVQLAFMMGAFVQGSILLVSFVADVTKQDTWLAVVAGFVVTLPFIILQAKLMDRFTGRTLAQVVREVYGSTLGSAILLYYLVYFTLLCTFNIRDIADFYGLFLQPDSPQLLILAGFALVCAYAATAGLAAGARMSHLFVALAAVILVSTSLLLAKDMDLTNFLPVLRLPLLDFVRGTHIVSTIGLGELTVFLTLMGSVRTPGSLVKPAFAGMAIGGASLLLAAIRDTAVLGPLQDIVVSPAYQSTRQIDYGLVFNRMDLLIGIGQTVLVFVKTSVLLYAAVLTLTQLLGLSERRPLILPFAGLIVVASAGMIRESSLIPAITTKSLMIIYQIPLVYIIPPLALLLARWRGLPRKTGDGGGP